MRKIFFVIILGLISVTAFSQSTQLDFSMQLQNTNNHQALIYPNPITDLNFKVKSSSVIIDIEVMNMLGKSVYHDKINNYTFDEISVRLPECDKGVYLVKITFDDNEYIIKKLLYQ